MVGVEKAKVFCRFLNRGLSHYELVLFPTLLPNRYFLFQQTVPPQSRRQTKPGEFCESLHWFYHRGRIGSALARTFAAFLKPDSTGKNSLPVF